MTYTNEEIQKFLIEWAKEYCNSGVAPVFKGFNNLGSSVRGRTYFKSQYYGRNCQHIVKYGEIEMNSRLTSNWRIKATLWHEFCHHWAWTDYNYSSHQGTFDTLVRREKVLWILCALSRCFPL